ncbi:MAG: response regulator [Cyanobacteria bacterium P01_G01_bin.67]
MHSNFDRNFTEHSKGDRPLVLVVDNDRDNLLLIGCVVESMGLNYVVTNESQQCLNLAEELLPDIILLDIVMPKMSGLEIAIILKQSEQLSHIPLLAVTGLTKNKDRQKLIEAGFDDYLSKPYLIEELEAKLNKLLKDPLA